MHFAPFKNPLYTFIFSSISMLIVFASQAQQRYWAGVGAGPLDWNSPANWSATSNGAAGASVPNATTIVYFDGALGRNGDCYLPNTNISVAEIRMIGTYSGTIYQQNGTLTVSGTMEVASGIFNGSNRNITVGTFSLNGGSFLATSAQLTFRGNVSFTSGTFNHNHGIVNFNATDAMQTITGNATLSNVFFKTTLYLSTSHVINDILTVINDLTVDTNNGNTNLDIRNSIAVERDFIITGTPADGRSFAINTGTIYVGRHIALNAPVVNAFSTGTIEINGTADQTLTSTVSLGRCRLPKVRINKPSGTLSLVGLITVFGPSWTHVSGTVLPGSSTIHFQRVDYGAAIIVSGDHSLGNVIFSGFYGEVQTVNNNLVVNDLTLDLNTSSMLFHIGGTIIANGTLRMNGANTLRINNGTIHAKGDIMVGTETNGAGNGTININGDDEQTLMGATTLGQGVLPNISIDKDGGTLTLRNYITVNGNWIYSRGNVDASTYESTVFLQRSSMNPEVDVSPIISTQSASGSMSFHHLQLDNPWRPAFNLDGDLQVNGNLTVTTGTTLSATASNYSVSIGGNFTMLTNAVFTSNGILVFNGTEDQNITFPGAQLYNLTMDKPSGALVLQSPIGIRAGSGPSLVLNNGMVRTTTSSILTLGAGSSTTIGNANSYIDGPINYNVATTSVLSLNLPLGKAEIHRPAVLSVKHSTAGLVTYTAEVFNDSAEDLGHTVPTDFTWVSRKRYWRVSRSSVANFDYGTIQLFFGTDDFVYNTNKLGMAKTDGVPSGPGSSDWRVMTVADVVGTGGPELTGSITSGQFTTPVGLFTLANLDIPGLENPLPVLFSSFKGESKEDGVLLKWSTATEINNNYFEIQRSVDGMSFETIGIQNSTAKNNFGGEYAFLDVNPLPGYNYYRIVQFDFDGQSNISLLVSAKHLGKFGVYPNPASSSFTIQLPFVPNSDGELIIQSLNGIAEMSVALPKIDSSYFEVDATDLKSGVYMLEIRIDGVVLRKKIFIR